MSREHCLIKNVTEIYFSTGAVVKVLSAIWEFLNMTLLSDALIATIRAIGRIGDVSVARTGIAGGQRGTTCLMD